MPTDATSLARRLRSLRVREWPDEHLTQRDLAAALEVSESLISSWESHKNPTVPPISRIDAYATFFATRRSRAEDSWRVLDVDELTTTEIERRESLRTELLALRDAAEQQPPGSVPDVASSNPWYYADRQPTLVICPELSDDILAGLPYADIRDPSYVRMHRFGELDALLSVYGHIRALNPAVHLEYKSTTSMTNDDYTKHLVVLGNAKVNQLTGILLEMLHVPVRHVFDDTDRPVRFVNKETGTQFAPVLTDGLDGPRLVQDIGHFVLATNPYNTARRLTICSGSFARGTYGITRTLTDVRFRQKNEEFLARLAAPRETASIVSKVAVPLTDNTITPDWTVPASQLDVWRSSSEAAVDQPV